MACFPSRDWASLLGTCPALCIQATWYDISLATWRNALVFVEPDTVVRWHRTAWRSYWTWRSRGRRPGRPRISAELQALIQQIARENPRWGAPRIVGELQALGEDVSVRTVRRYRQAARRHPPSRCWRTFLRNHAPHIWATDLFTVQSVTFRTFYVAVVISHDRRRIEHWNVTAHPPAAWVWQQLIEATAWGRQPCFLIRDRDRCFGGDFVARAAGIGITTILTPVRVPPAATSQEPPRRVQRLCIMLAPRKESAARGVQGSASAHRIANDEAGEGSWA